MIASPISSGETTVTAGSAADRRLSRNVLWSYAAWTVTALAPLVTVPFCVRYLGHQLYGEWLVIMSLTSYLGLTNLGLAQTVGNRIAEAVAHGRRGEVGVLAATGFWAYLVIAVVLLVALASGASLITPRFIRLPQSEAAVFLIYASLACASMPFKIYQVTLRGFARVDCEQALEAGGTIARVLLTAATLMAGFKLIALALINGGTALAIAIAAYPVARRLDADVRPSLAHCSWPLLRTIVRPSAAFFALQSGTTLTLGMDNLVIGATLGAGAVTSYAVPFRLIWIASLVFSVAINAVMPAITGHYAHARKPLLARGYLLALRLALLFGTFGAILLWVAGPRLIALWAGPGIFPGRLAFALQIVFFFLLVWTAPPAALLAATTNHYRYAMITIASGIFNLALSLLWVRRFGLAGVIGATVVASILTTTWYVTIAAPRLLNISWRRMWCALWRPLMLTLLALSAFSLAPPLKRDIMACACLAFIVTTYALLVFTVNERRAARHFLRELCHAA